MQRIYFLTILLFSTMINYYTDFGFSLESETLIGLWLLFYAVILPISLMSYVFNKYRASLDFCKTNLCVSLSYLLSLFLSSLDFLDFKNFVIRGDGATQYVVKIIFTVCFVSSFTSFLFFQIKNQKIK